MDRIYSTLKAFLINSFPFLETIYQVQTHSKYGGKFTLELLPHSGLENIITDNNKIEFSLSSLVTSENKHSDWGLIAEKLIKHYKEL